MENKIYTKKGDKGETSLLGGKKVSKSHPRVEAYGNIDELNSFLGLMISEIKNDETGSFLTEIQNHLYFIGSLVACDSCKEQEKLRRINDKDIEDIEKEIDKITNELPELKEFIIPGGSRQSSLAHICRTVCRRAERSVTELMSKTPIDEMIIIYLNRLSDYFFTLSRKLLRDEGKEEMKYRKG